MKRLVPIMVILLLISTSFVGVGNQVEELMVDNEQDELLDNLAFYCYDDSGFGSVKYEYLREELLEEYLYQTNVVETESQSIISNPTPVVGSPPMDSAWPMLCQNNHHTSQSPYSTSHITDLEKWRFTSDEGIESSPIIGYDGSIYFGDKDAYVVSISSDGFLNWKYRTDSWITSAPALSEDGTLYVGSWDDGLYAFNSTTGQKKWRCDVGGTIASSPAIDNDGTIYVGTMRGFDKGDIVAINPSGSIKWIYPTGYLITCDPAIGDDGIIYIGSGDDYFYAMNPNGTLKWRFETGHYIKGPASIADDGTIYVGSYDDYLYALYSNGTLRWKTKIGTGTETNPSIANDGTIYVGDDKLYAVNPSNGSIKWSLNLGNDRFIFKSCPTISADGIIYIGVIIGIVGYPEGGELLAVNPDGTERWRKQISNYVVDSSPCIAEDGTIYIGSESTATTRGYIHAFGPVESNSPPETPTISGKTEGEIWIKYRYNIKSVDPDNHPISYFIDWGDGNEAWELERASGENCSYWHQWETKGNYTIRVKAKDELGEESDWAYLEVTMPHIYSSFWWLNSLLDRFPLLQRLLERLI